jgi:hypothetical protein
MFSKYRHFQCETFVSKTSRSPVQTSPRVITMEKTDSDSEFRHLPRDVSNIIISLSGCTLFFPF